jgi:hypothetical protein
MLATKFFSPAFLTKWSWVLLSATNPSGQLALPADTMKMGQ